MGPLVRIARWWRRGVDQSNVGEVEAVMERIAAVGTPSGKTKAHVQVRVECIDAPGNESAARKWVAS